jgi:MmgE/PrpD N-terminal domain
MISIERRHLLRTTATAIAVGASGPALAQGTNPPAAAPPPGGAPKGPLPAPVTHIIAKYAATTPLDQIPAPVRKEATRTLLNWVGCAVGGSRQDEPSHAVAALNPSPALSRPACLGARSVWTRCMRHW